MGLDNLSALYKKCEYFCCNVEEAQEILNTKNRDVKELLDGIANCGPKIVTITDGGDGAYLRDRRGNKYYLPTYPDIETPKERTGAGDAFTSTMLSFMAMGYDETEAIVYAPINSMNVVQYIGAQKGLLTLKEITKLYKNRPDMYFLREI
ncbi:MAG: carbohydrate kinase family protein [Cyanobium sp. MAG06]|nr:carbohydrate kinase family protein [Cyanobium sp. MAG06]